MKKWLKLLICILLIGVGVFGHTKDIEAASFSMGVSTSTVAPGGTFTVTISGQCIGRVNFSVSNGTLSSSAEWIENNVVSVTVKAGSSGTVVVTASPTEGFSDADGNPYNPGSRSVSVSIVNKQSGGGSSSSSTSRPQADNRSKNNNLSTLKEGAQKGIPCSRPCPMITGSGSVKVTITPIGEELKYELSDGFKINLNHNNHDLTVEAFKDKCPKFYCQCGSSGENKYCSVSLNHHFDIFDRDEAQQSYEEQEAGKNTDHNSQVDTNVTLDDTIVGDGFCEEDSTRRVLSLVGIILMIAKVLVPLIIILIGSIDLFKAVMSKDEKDLMKSVKSIGLRLLVGIFIFFVPTIVDVVIDLVRDGHNENQCVECVLNPLDCRE